MKLTKRLIRDQLATNFWTALTVFVVSGVFRLLQAILGENMIFSLFDAEDPNWPHLDGAAEIADPMVVAGVALGVVAMVCYVVSIVAAATTRTYLGAGLARRSFLKTQLAVWGVSAVSVAIATLIIALARGIRLSDFSGTLGFDGVPIPSLLWYVPIAALVGIFLAHALGFLTGMVFVRYPWWVGVGAIALFVLVDGWTNGGISSWGGFLDWQLGAGGSQLVKHVVAGCAESVVIIGISWALLRHLSIRR